MKIRWSSVSMPGAAWPAFETTRSKRARPSDDAQATARIAIATATRAESTTPKRFNAGPSWAGTGVTLPNVLRASVATRRVGVPWPGGSPRTTHRPPGLPRRPRRARGAGDAGRTVAEEGREGPRASRGEARPAPGAADGGGPSLAVGRAAGDGHQRQGRNDQARVR